MNLYGYIGRKIRQPDLKEKPAIIIVPFGSGSRAGKLLSQFLKKLEKQFPGHSIFTAYSSEVLRRKLNLPSLQECLATVEAMGFRRAVVQPLHIFPGTEYTQLMETSHFFPGIRVIFAESLLHRWEYIRACLETMEKDFLPAEKGLNLLAIHGTPLATEQVNSIYLGLERMLTDRYPNVLLAAIEGIPDFESVLAQIDRKKPACPYKRIRIIPMMLIAGIHVEDDLMGDNNSWRRSLEKRGFLVDCPRIVSAGGNRFAGLADSPAIFEFFMERIERALFLEKSY
jgi:sirohydrochlorin cobaltochelatase